jgi:preprotein translocase subunit SecY
VRARESLRPLVARTLGTYAQAFRTPDLRRKLLFTLGIIVLFRFGANLPAPGISEANVRYCSGLTSTSSDPAAQISGMLNVISGNALLHVAVFAVGIMPYITASIILQLLTQVVPRLERLKHEGKSGTSTITQYTRYLTVGLAILECAGYVELARSGNLFPGTGCTAVSHPLIPHSSVATIATMLITMVAGTSVVMWLGELITDRGIGNGMSVLIFTSTISYLPSQMEQVYFTKGVRYVAAAVAIGVGVIAFVVFMEQAQRRIPVQYAKRMIGRRMYGGAATYIPVKVNQAGVIPVIFASSLLYIPQLGALWFGNQDRPQGWMTWIDRYLTPTAIGSANTASANAAAACYFTAWFLLIVAFTYFYASISFNPVEVADNMQKYGGFLPGIRPGRPTAEYLGYVLRRLTAAGSVYLGVIALFPLVTLSLIGIGSEFSSRGTSLGTSLLIMVGVGLDTVKQIEGQLRQHTCEGFLR